MRRAGTHPATHAPRYRQLTLKNRSLLPPGPTGNRTVCPHLAHRALYSVADAFRYAR